MSKAKSCANLDITVIVCTYNRCGDLARALESIAASQVACSVSWEVLVVDNGSTDQTRHAVEGFSRRYSDQFRYYFEPKQGLSFARNAGVANSRGEILVFTDDDVVVEPTWLRNLTAGLFDSRWAGAGGKILPAQKFEPPPWLPDNLFEWGGIFCAYFDLGENPRTLERPPYGANMAFRRSVFAKYGGFRTDLGRNACDKLCNEDTELGRRLLTAGERLRYEPSAVVYHPIPHGRLTPEYFYSWWFDYGRSMIRERGDRPPLCGIPRNYLSLLRFAVRMPAITMRWMVAINRQRRFRNKCWVWHAGGQMRELYQHTVFGKLSNPIWKDAKKGWRSRVSGKESIPSRGCE
jgi:glucosyl-dolichyl phosphate glucuronosyltransferase